MEAGAVYVDDSGNPGQETGSDFLPPSRKSWTGVIVPSVVAADVMTAMDMFLKGVRNDFGVKELHFTDVFSGKGQWKGVPVARRIEVFDLMSGLMGSFDLPVIHITTSEETLLDHAETWARLKLKEGEWWNLADISHLGFLRLCSVVARYLRRFCQDAPDEFSFPMPLFVDEGLMKAGGKAGLPNWGDVFRGPRAEFCRSSEVPGIQLADFAAFSLTRSQWITVKHETGRPVSDSEREFLRTTSQLNVLNLAWIQVQDNEFGRERYEEILSADRIEKGLSPRHPRKH